MVQMAALSVHRTWIISTCLALPLFSSFCSMEETMRQDARRVPMTFLYATESRFRSSTVSSTCVRQQQ
jgi:hypothetical protein